jgi:hypothetical protein
MRHALEVLEDAEVVNAAGDAVLTELSAQHNPPLPYHIFLTGRPGWW